MSESTAKQIRSARNKLGYSQQHLAERAGVSIATVSAIERGGMSPTVNTIEKIARALNVEIIIGSIDCQKN